MFSNIEASFLNALWILPNVNTNKDGDSPICVGMDPVNALPPYCIQLKRRNQT